MNPVWFPIGYWSPVVLGYGLGLYFNNPFVPLASWVVTAAWTAIYLRSRR